jgi:hypothetical protein
MRIMRPDGGSRYDPPRRSSAGGLPMLGAYRLPLSFDSGRMLAELPKVESEIHWHGLPDYTVAMRRPLTRE